MFSKKKKPVKKKAADKKPAVKSKPEPVDPNIGKTITILYHIAGIGRGTKGVITDSLNGGGMYRVDIAGKNVLIKADEMSITKK